MGDNFKPGDVAMVMGAGRRQWMQAMWTRNGWVCVESVSPLDRSVDPRPLLVIDPEDREQVVSIVERFFMHHTPDSHGYDGMQSALRSLANPAPAIPDEPTDPAVRVVDSVQGEWARRSDGRWICLDKPGQTNKGLTWEQASERWGTLEVVTPDAPTDRPFKVGDRVRVAEDAQSPSGSGLHSFAGLKVTLREYETGNRRRGWSSDAVRDGESAWGLRPDDLTLIDEATS